METRGPSIPLPPESVRGMFVGVSKAMPNPSAREDSQE